MGKSYLIEKLIEIRKLTHDRNKYLIVAPTGIAAQNVGGQTTNSIFRWGVDLPIKGKLKDGTRTWKYRGDAMIYLCDIIICDEISMVNMAQLDSIYSSIYQANKVRRKMGLDDIQFVALGDCYQLPPVIPNYDRAILEDFYGRDIGLGYAFNSDHWHDFRFRYIGMNQVMRQDSKVDKSLLNAVRNGCNDPRIILRINLRTSGHDFPGAPWLFATNARVDQKNMEELDKLYGKPHVYNPKYSDDLQAKFDEIEEKSGKEAVLNYKKSLGMYRLGLKVNARVMITANSRAGADWFETTITDIDAGKLFQNGTIGVIREIYDGYGEDDPSYIAVEIKTRDGKYIPVKFFRMAHDVFEFESHARSGGHFRKQIGKWYQFPLKLAYGISIHKCQGLTLDYINVDLSDLFSPAQLYVALSRCVSLKNIYLKRWITPEDVKIDRNVVEFYAELEGRDPNTTYDASDAMEGWSDEFGWSLVEKGPEEDDEREGVKFDEFGRVYKTRKEPEGWDSEEVQAMLPF